MELDPIQVRGINPERAAVAAERQAATQAVAQRGVDPKVAQAALAKVAPAAPKIGMMAAARGVATKALPVVGQGMALYGAGRALGGAAGAIKEGNYGDVLPAAARGFFAYE